MSDNLKTEVDDWKETNNIFADIPKAAMLGKSEDRCWAPTSTVTVEVEKKPDFELKVWKADNGYMIEILGRKLIARNETELANLIAKTLKEA